MYKFVKNSKDLLNPSLSDSIRHLRTLALDCLEIGILSVLPKKMIEKSLSIENNILSIMNDQYDLSTYESIYIVGGGKASADMAFALQKMLKRVKDISYKGIINVPKGIPIKNHFDSRKIRVNIANHPIPNKTGYIGTKNMIELVNKSNSNDLIICLISGGGSALLTLPKPGISLEDLKEVNELLLNSGASINEINTIRKHLSDFKGGNLVRKIYQASKATVISLIISDVVGNNLDTIGSGPTVPDSTTYGDAIKIIKDFGLYGKMPSSVINLLESGNNNPEMENPKDYDPCFRKVSNYLIGSAELAIQAISNHLNSCDFQVYTLKSSLQGEARIYGTFLAEILRQKLDELKPGSSVALLGSGELTVTITGNGKGGRNQEMLLSLLKEIRNDQVENKFLVLGVNLDGIEGNSKAMGALIDNQVLNDIGVQKIDLDGFLINNDSNSFFKQMNTQIITGLTGVNVNDILLVLFQKF
ncbi:MAG: DUF4147 domain-containing protein [Promethearchaeota archaeon]|nr:MAG: DUF4147 domain-containing protein [Candidatus Lokiarchaeota archaeon]